MRKNEKHPSEYHRDLTEDRLRVVSKIFLDTIEDSKDIAKEIGYVGPWGEGCLCFERPKYKLIDEINSKKYPWLTLAKGDMDYIFNIGSVPCRYFKDDLDSPRKKNFYVNRMIDDLFPIDSHDVVLYRFVYQDSNYKDEEGTIHFVGYNALQELVFTWKYEEYQSNNYLYVVESEAEEPKKLSPVSVDIKDDSEDNSAPDVSQQSNN